MALEGACGVETESEHDGNAHVVDGGEKPDSITSTRPDKSFMGE